MEDEDNLIDSVFSQLDKDRESGKLTKNLTIDGGYGISSKYPDYISKYSSAGKLIAVGKFIDGKFQPLIDL